MVAEERQTQEESYGKDNTIKMLFTEFVQQMKSGNEKLYLTAQDVLSRYSK